MTTSERKGKCVDDSTAVDANAELEHVVGPVSDLELLDAGQQIERHGGDLSGVVVAVAARQAADHHVGVAYCLDLVDVVVFDDAVE